MACVQSVLTVTGQKILGTEIFGPWSPRVISEKERAMPELEAGMCWSYLHGFPALP